MGTCLQGLHGGFPHRACRNSAKSQKTRVKIGSGWGDRPCLQVTYPKSQGWGRRKNKARSKLCGELSAGRWPTTEQMYKKGAFLCSSNKLENRLGKYPTHSSSQNPTRFLEVEPVICRSTKAEERSRYSSSPSVHRSVQLPSKSHQTFSSETRSIPDESNVFTM